MAYVDVLAWPAHGGAWGVHDVLARIPPESSDLRQLVIVRYPHGGAWGTFDVLAYPPELPAEVAPGGSFPPQFQGLRVWHGGALLELCLVATADAPAGMGGQPRIHKAGTTYAIYLVETTDPNASPVRLQTSAGTKAIRRLT